MAKQPKATSTRPDERLVAIGQKLRRLRQFKGYTSYEKFAYDHDLPRVGYGNHEQGTNLTMSSLLRLLDIHGLTLAGFFQEADNFPLSPEFPAQGPEEREQTDPPN